METEGDSKYIGERELHQTPQSIEQGHGSTNNSHVEAHPSSSSSSQNSFLVPTSNTNAANNIGNECMKNDPSSTNLVDSTHYSSTGDILSPSSLLIPSSNDSSPEDPFHEPTNIDNKTLTSENDVHNSSMQKHGHGQGSEIQNPPVQVMERPGEPGTSPRYHFPSHVFSNSNGNSQVEWSTASNESLFSIYMGNTSFSSELACFKSFELDKPGEVCMHDHPNASPTHQPPAPVNKFNDISQRTAEKKLLHEESSKATEAKAAETMREVILESSQATENADKGDDKVSNSHRRSDSSTKSYAFQSSKDRDKSVSPKGVAEKQNQQKQTEESETSNAAGQTPKTTTNAPNKWLSCFSCCSFC